MSQGENPEIERKMLMGCTGYVLLSLGGFLIGAWPFFVWTQHWRLEALFKCALLGLLPNLLVGIVGTRKFGIPGATGFFAAGLATAIFLYLRLWQMFLGFDARSIPEPEYPRAFVQLVPLIWVILVAFLAIFSLNSAKSELSEG